MFDPPIIGAGFKPAPARYCANTSFHVVTGHSFWKRPSTAGLPFSRKESASGITTCRPLRCKPTSSLVSPLLSFSVAQFEASLHAGTIKS